MFSDNPLSADAPSSDLPLARAPSPSDAPSPSASPERDRRSSSPSSSAAPSSPWPPKGGKGKALSKIVESLENEQPSEAGFLDPARRSPAPIDPAASALVAIDPPVKEAASAEIRQSWSALLRWSQFLSRSRSQAGTIDRTEKVVVFGGGSFGTAMACVLARQKPDMDVVMLLRDPYLCKDINGDHCNTRYLPEFKLPKNVRATTSALEAIQGAQYAVHAVPVQSSRAFLQGIASILPSNVPIVCVSKGLEVSTGKMMSEVIPEGLGRKQPAAFLSGPSFAREVMESRPTAVVVASKDRQVSRAFQQLFACPYLRVNTTKDVVGVEIAGALKNVLAIAAGIVDGMELGHNALAALVAQGCTEIRWLAEKMGADPRTLSGVSGLGDIMLTCYVNLSRNRTVGRRLGAGESLADILGSSTQVAEGVSTAGAVVRLARKYRVSLPVLTAVAQIVDNQLSPREAVQQIMALPQVEEV